MTTSATQPEPSEQTSFRFPTAEDGSIQLDDAPTADLMNLAAAVLAVVAERRSAQGAA